MEANEIAKLSVRAKSLSMGIVLGFLRETLNTLGIPIESVNKLTLATEEASMNVIEHAFDPGEDGAFDIIVRRFPGQICIAVEDKGLPINFSKMDSTRSAGLGMTLMRGVVDAVEFVNLGRRGKRVEFTLNLPYLMQAEPREDNDVPQASPDIPLTIRMVDLSDVDSIVRCVYRSYGYSYIMEMIYYPEKYRESLLAGTVRSVVSVDPDGEVAGHLAMMFETPNSLVAETGMAVVDPRYRGRGIFKDLKKYLFDWGLEHGLRGFYSEAVACHPFSQKGNKSIGAHETGYELGVLPTSMNFRQIQDRMATQRQSVALFYMKINEGPEQTVYIPYHHRAIAAKIYGQHRLPRLFNGPEDPGFPQVGNLPDTSVLNMKLLANEGLGTMWVEAYGKDIVEVVRFRLKEALQQKCECMLLDLPLSDPMTAKFCASIEILGFFFAGIIPELRNGDVLRLIFLDHVILDLDQIAVVSDYGRDLFEYVSNAYLDVDLI